MSEGTERRLTRSTALRMGTSPAIDSSSKKLTRKVKTLEQAEDNKSKRKIIKAKRFMKSKTVQLDEPQNEVKVQQETLFNNTFSLTDENHQSVCKINIENLVDLMPENGVNITQDKKETGTIESFHALNEQADETIITLDSFEEKRSSIESKFTITTLTEKISPSTTSLDLTTSLKSPVHLQFDCSEENLYPTCDSSPPNRRRTFELEASVNDITLLKSVSKDDSVRMNSFPSDQESLPSPIGSSCTTTNHLSKVTVRRKLPPRSNTVSRVSRFSPPWNPTNICSSKCTPAKESAKKLKSICKNTKRESKSTSKKIKIPNFAAIHQRAFEKMENLSEYKKRKEERAKMLLSGMKPIDQKSLVEKPKRPIRKQLTFAVNIVEKDKSPTYIPLPSTPMPKQKLPVDSSEVRTPIQSFKRGERNSSTPIPNHKPFDNDFCKMKTPHFKREKENYKPTPFKLQFKVGTPNFKFSEIKENGPVFFKTVSNKNEAIKKSKIPTKILALKNYNAKMPLPCGNKPNLKNVLLKEDLKAMIATKSKIKVIDVEKRRTAIKGVRTNRRFELLMNMRKGK